MLLEDLALAKLVPHTTTPPCVQSKSRDEEHQLRSSQLQHRVAEMRAAWQYVQRATVASDGASKDPSSNALATLVGRLDATRVAVEGHSFGGITALAYASGDKLAAEGKPGGVRACVAYVQTARCVCCLRSSTLTSLPALPAIRLDPWLFPLSAAQRKAGVPHVPSMVMFGDYFTKWADNAAQAKGNKNPCSTHCSSCLV